MLSSFYMFFYSYEEDASELPSELVGILTVEAEQEARMAAKNVDRAGAVGGVDGSQSSEQGHAKKQKV